MAKAAPTAASVPLNALFDGSVQFHTRDVSFMLGLRYPLVTDLPVITEVVYMLDFVPQAQRDFLFWAAGAVTIDTKTRGDLPRIRALLEKYSDLPADFADVSLVALCEHPWSTTVASESSDFTIYRMQDRKDFRNLFFED
ncbi:pilus assembly protein [Thiohalocapsa marina]|uniref:Pilus assembly protein n=1 Tax=Thiohalocapsa marina TaxID=424902 RepID=A0A5M8FMJ3_9GAMM|nr:pilus assembly protein [Thiohalocapsa marina]KAA6186078.1 pilus assembly protein [Thiohalocapsa marina]